MEGIRDWLEKSAEGEVRGRKIYEWSAEDNVITFPEEEDNPEKQTVPTYHQCEARRKQESSGSSPAAV